jgi:adenine-specific DNA-methyltransferase
MAINKEDAQKLGFSIINTQDKNMDLQNKKITEIKNILPNLINSDNKLNIQALEDLIGLTNTTYKKSGYELNFVGKALAKTIADEEPKYELALEKNRSKNMNNTNNIVITGDNIEVLKLLKLNYEAKIKMIYIDPPYNTGTENFIYKDNFKDTEKDLIEKFNLAEDDINYIHNIYGTKNHSGWLSFMYPRLVLARNLLKEDGVIFISIDDNEQANLKLLCDEIFGEENFVASWIWQRNFAPKNDNKYISISTEYIIMFAKNKLKFDRLLLPRESKHDEKYFNPDNDHRGEWTSGSILASRIGNSTPFEIIAPNGKKHLPPQGRDWRYSKDTIDKLREDNRLYFGKDGNGVPRVKRFLSEMPNGIVPQNLLLYKDVGSAQDAQKTIKDLFNGSHIFDYPKPINLIKKFLIVSTSSQNDDIILDFFAGSGTTGQAVMELNKEDGGNRKFILVQIDDPVKTDSTAYKNGFKTIDEITIARLDRAGERIKANNNTDDMLQEHKDVDIGYKVFKLSKKQDVEYNSETKLFSIQDVHNNDDMLYNMLIKTDVLLDEKITKITDNIYKINSNYYIINNITQNDKDSILHNVNEIDNIYINGFCDIQLDNLLTLLNIKPLKQDWVKIIY